ncbi:hypothetical protein IAR55_006601 [Kwoniella newhampshirensis]|uniref:GATA-type domain-containing protein n=1 Tax=Kwoniella newhampshirensis TaxID=1651941 RepID=A0AAW0YTJ6_9TREE
MPPSPGKIHSLPVKVLYSIDTSPQSYVTVLHDRQDVYVHTGSPGYGLESDQGPVGSCSLKAVARGICFASPECIPHTTSLDFSVYNLDPAFRRPSVRAFPSSPADDASSWTGRGFLSWSLGEPDQGSTLIKGRLVREYEFSSTYFAPEGGLEGLMAAAASSRGSREEMDGKGWGLEVGISLRQLNPEGKVEFQGRKEFEDMLAKGRSVSVSSPAAIPAVRSSPHPSTIPRPGDGTPTVTGTPQPGPSASSTTTVRPMAHPSPVPIHSQPQSQSQSQISRPSSASIPHRASSSSLPPSSLPPHPSSSNSNLNAPSSSRPSSAAGNRQPVKPEPPSQAPLNQPESSRAASQQRQITPPPIPRPKSPPPSTPSRSKLHALLQADGMMSPNLARHLASNPVLRNLLKAVPSNSGALTALRNITGITGPGPGQEKGKKADNGNGDGDKDESPEATTPTPTPNKPLPELRNMRDGCCNCGTMVSTCWRTKKMKDGTPRKVCDDCGLYFNEHKRMRPPELWGQSQLKPGASQTTAGLTQTANETKRKLPHHDPFSDGPATGLRSSPRLNRTNSDKDTHTLSNDHASSSKHHGGHVVPESPRKRQKTGGKAVPHPSPRMTTRASAKVDPASTGADGDFSAEAFGFSPNTIFGTSPVGPGGNGEGQSIGSVMSGMMSTHGHDISGLATGATASGVAEGDMDLSALLAQMEGGVDGFSLDSLFTGMDGASGVELSQEMMDLLAGWEGQLGAEGFGLDGGGEMGHINGHGHVHNHNHHLHHGQGNGSTGEEVPSTNDGNGNNGTGDSTAHAP